MSTKTKIKQLITAYLNFKEVYEAGLTEKQLTKVRNIMYDFSSFIDETTVNEFDIDDDEDYTSNNNENNSSLYILNDETGEMEQYDWDYIETITIITTQITTTMMMITNTRETNSTTNTIRLNNTNTTKKTITTTNN